VESEHGAWDIFLKNPEIIQFSHAQASTIYHRESTVLKKRVVDLADFRQLLIHMYAISVLWVHFKHADDFMSTDDLGNLKLSLPEYTLAVKTLCASKAGETITDAQIQDDFTRLDLDLSGSIGFVEVISPRPSTAVWQTPNTYWLYFLTSPLLPVYV
jgi:hypothetical protein